MDGFHREDGLPSSEELAAAVMTLTAMVAQLRARLRLMELFLDHEVSEFDRKRYRMYVEQHLEEVQSAIEDRTREVMRHAQPVAIQEMHSFFQSLSQDLPVLNDPAARDGAPSAGSEPPSVR